MHCAGRNKRIHNDSFDGHENYAHGQKVSKAHTITFAIQIFVAIHVLESDSGIN